MTAEAHPRAGVARPSALRLVVLGIISPTWAVAAFLKPSNDKPRRAKVIVRLNRVYLAVAVVSTAIVFLWFGNDARPLQAHAWNLGYCAWTYFLWSRCAEVFIAFYADAIDKLARKRAASDLSGAQRVVLALNSYVELSLDYALIYGLLPATLWRDSPPASFTDLLWYSASTITTSGGGGFVPLHWVPQFLSTLEIFGGVILLVVCFTLYAGLASEGGTLPPPPTP